MRGIFSVAMMLMAILMIPQVGSSQGIVTPPMKQQPEVTTPVKQMPSKNVGAKRKQVEETLRKQEAEANRKQEELVNISAPDAEINGHGYVDLGLPSGLKWATCNVGASTPFDYGNYYIWGGTTPHKTSPIRLKGLWEDKSESELQSAGIINSAGNLTMTYDAARAIWGASWRMPSKAEMIELVHHCKWIWISQGGHTGYKVTGTNGKSIFLPTAGFITTTVKQYVGEEGRYLSSYCYDGSRMYILEFLRDSYYTVYCNTYCWCSIRAVSE